MRSVSAIRPSLIGVDAGIVGRGEMKTQMYLAVILGAVFAFVPLVGFAASPEEAAVTEVMKNGM